jgi:hypothetical protein
VLYPRPSIESILLVVSGLSKDEQQRLEEVVGRRVGARSDAPKLVEAYRDAMVRNAYARTTGDGPVPTSLTAERSMILIEISRQLERVIEDFEIQALLRVTMSAARAMRTTLLSTYSDDADKLTLAWALRGARTTPKRTKADAFTGPTIVFESKDRRDAFVDNVQRSGVPVQVIHGDLAMPWKVVVGDAFPKAQLPPRK